jgi:hypothetical protein
LRDTWLNIPQAVVLEIAGNLQMASELEADDPNLLMIKAIRRLPPLTSIEVDAFPNEIETLRQQYRLAVASRAKESIYENGLRRVHAKLIKGVTAKGSRAPNRPLEVIDPAEFARLELRGIDAVDVRTRKPVWYSIVTSAHEQLEGRSGVCEQVARADTTLILARAGTAPLSARDLRSWYQQRIQDLMLSGKTASGEADWKAARQKYPGRVTRARLHALRKELAPERWQKQGRRSPPATE